MFESPLIELYKLSSDISGGKPLVPDTDFSFRRRTSGDASFWLEAVARGVSTTIPQDSFTALYGLAFFLAGTKQVRYVLL